MDRIRIQVEYKKGLWICPTCGQEDEQDFNVGGGNTYEHICSNEKCREKFNQSAGRLRTFHNFLTFSETEYQAKTEKDIADAKKEKFDAWVYEIKNPPEYQNPSKEDLERMLMEKQEEVDKIQQEIEKKEISIGN